MTRIIAITLAKGGVGKTTTAVNLAAGLAAAGRRVLLVDTDTQGQLAGALGINPEHDISRLVLSADTDAILNARERLDLVAGGMGVNHVIRQIASRDYKKHALLAETFQPLEDNYDYILFDTAPSWNEISVNVLAYCTDVLCPIPLETLAVRGAQAFVQRAMPILNDTGASLRYVVPTMLDRRLSQTAEIHAMLTRAFGDVVCDPIRINARLSEAPAHGETIFEYAPKSRGAEDYQKLTNRVMADE